MNKREHQRFRQGARVVSISVRRDRSTDEPYIRITDVHKHFPGVSLFSVNSVFLHDLEDKNDQVYEPIRIAFCPGDIIDVAVADPVQPSISPPASPSSVTSIRTSCGYPHHPVVAILADSIASSVSFHSSSPSPRRSSLARSSTYSSFRSSTSSRTSFSTDAQYAISVAQPMAIGAKIASVATHTHHQIDQLSNKQSANHNEVMQQFVHVLQGQAESKLREEQILAKQQDTIERLIVAQQRLEAILVQNYELHEYPIPRLFVILPGSYERWDLRNLMTDTFRLYFLCECGDHCNPSLHPTQLSRQQSSSSLASLPSSIPAKNSVHIANHEGYELSRPTEFFDQYGPYVLGMLRILKHCLAVATVVSPAVALAQNGVREVLDSMRVISESTLRAVEGSINFLVQRRDVDARTDNTTKGGTEMQDDAFSNLFALAGADLRRLDSFLQKKDTDKTLGNLYRITTKTGHVKWVCLEHYEQVYRDNTMAAFIQFVETNGGTHNPQLGEVTISLKSSAVFKDFFLGLSTQGLTVSSIKVTLDRYLFAADLAMLVAKICLSNVRDVHLDFREFKTHAAIVSQAQAGRGRYNSLLGFLSNIKLRSLTFTNIGLFGPRTSSLPTDQPLSLLQSFHFSAAIKSVDDHRLADVISHCRQVVDLRLGSIAWSSEDVPKVDEAIGLLSKLEVLRRYHMYAKSWTEAEVTSTSAPYGYTALREIVDFGLPYPTGANGLLENAIRLSSATLEVLLLRPKAESSTSSQQVHFLNPRSPRSLAGRPPFSKLTHLELFVHITPASLKLISSVLPGLPLVHLGIGQHTAGLLAHANYRFLKSLYLKPADKTSIDALYRSIVKSSVSAKCQIESLRLDWMLLVKSSLTVVQKVTTVATVNKLDFENLGENLKLLSRDPLAVVNRSINFVDQILGDGPATTNEEEEVLDSLEGLFDLFAVLPLKTLILERMGGQGLETVLKFRSLSQLQVLVINDEKYRWATEAILASRSADFASDFTVQLVYNTKKHLRDVYKTGSRKVQGSSTRLPRHRVKPVEYPTFEKEYYSSVLSSFSQ